MRKTCGVVLWAYSQAKFMLQRDDHAEADEEFVLATRFLSVAIIQLKTMTTMLASLGQQHADQTRTPTHEGFFWQTLDPQCS